MTTKQDAIEYLQDIREHYNNYHEHKEKSAWAGVALYVLFAGTLLPIQLRGPNEIAYDILYTSFILIVATLVFLYVRNQFDLKNEGRVYVAAAMQLTTEIMAMDDQEFEANDFFKLPETEDQEYDSDEILPNQVLNKADEFRHPTTHFGPSDISKFLCYLIITTLTGGLLATRFVL